MARLDDDNIPAMEIPPVGLVIPCYNEAARLQSEELIDFCSRYPQIQLLLVNDGSLDDTEKVLRQLVAKAPENIECLSLATNSGKAEAVRRGVLQLAQDPTLHYIGYLDADLSTPLDEIPYMLEMTRYHHPAHIILGSRVFRGGARIHRSAARHYLSRIFVTVRDWMLPLGIYDTQCGAKLVEAFMIQPLFSEPFISKWLFDVEVLARLSLLLSPGSLRDFALEVPLRTWVEKGDSRISWKNCFYIPRELIRISLVYRQRRRGKAKAADDIFAL